MGRRSGAFSAFTAAAQTPASPSKAGVFSRLAEEANSNGSPDKKTAAPPASRPRATVKRPVPELTLDQVRNLLEELRTVSSSTKFQKDLAHLRNLDWGAFKKREAVAKLLSIFWRAPLRKYGFSIDANGFPHLLQVVKANGNRPGIRVVSHEVERQLKMIPGTLFGLTSASAGENKSWKEEEAQKAKVSAATETPQKAKAQVPAVKRVRDRDMFLGEAKEMLKAFKDALTTPAVKRTIQNIEQKGGMHVEKHRRLLITQEWNPILKRFDFPVTEDGYEAMKAGIRQFGENDYVRTECHEIERLCNSPSGGYFGVPTIQEQAARRRAEQEAERRREEEERRKAEEARKAEEEKRKAEEEKRRAEQEKREAEEFERLAQEARRKKAEEEQRRAEEAKRKAEEDAKRAEEEKSRAEDDAKRQEKEDKQRGDEQEQRKQSPDENASVEEEAGRTAAEAEETKKAKEADKKAEDTDDRMKEWASGLFDFDDLEPVQKTEEAKATEEATKQEERVEEEQKKAEEEKSAEEEAKQRAEEEERRQAEEESRIAEEAKQKAKEEESRVAEEAKQRAEEEERRKTEEESRIAEEDKQRAEEEERRTTEEESRMAEEAKQRAEEEERRKAEEEKMAEEAKQRAEEEQRRKEEEERQTAEADEKRRAEEESKIIEDQEKRAEEANRQAEEEQRKAEEEKIAEQAKQKEEEQRQEEKEKKRMEDEKKAEEAKKRAEQLASDQRRLSEAKRKVEEEMRIAEEKKQKEEEKAEEGRRRAAEEAENKTTVEKENVENGVRPGLFDFDDLEVDAKPGGATKAAKPEDASDKNTDDEIPCFEVVHDRVALREQPSAQAKVVGVANKGVQLFGTARIVDGQKWFHVGAQSCRQLGAFAEEAWALVHGSSLGLGELLRPASKQLPQPLGYAGRFEVSHNRVAVRASPAMDGKIVGVVFQGRILMGTPHKVDGQAWLRFEESSRNKVAQAGEEAWALILGTSLGLGQLLRPLDADGRKVLDTVNEEASTAPAIPPAANGKPAQEETVAAPTKPDSAAPTVQDGPSHLPTSPPPEASAAPVDPAIKVAACQKAAQQAQEVLQGPVEYLVVGTDQPAPVRREPLVQAEEMGRLQRGQAVLGYPGGGWLQLCPGASLDARLANSWVFIGTRLAARWAELSVSARFAEAIEVSWPGLTKEKRVAYSVEWRTAEGAAQPLGGHKVSRENKAVVSGLPAGSEVRLRVAARVLTEQSAGSHNPSVDEQDVRLWGPWAQEATAAAIPQDLEDAGEQDRDPFGQERGGCSASSCWTYAAHQPNGNELANNSIAPEMVRCARCGAGYGEHVRGQERTSALGRSLASYEVLHSAVFVRGSRSTKGAKLGALRKGQVVLGRREGSWLRLGAEALKQAAPSSAGDAEAAGWVLVDGSSLGLGQLLAPKLVSASRP